MKDLIPLYSAIISAVVSFFVGWSTVRLELNKLRLATQQLAFTELLKVRIQEYPKLYSILSDLGKIARHESVTVNLKNIRDRIEQWDSAHAIFMTRETSNRCYEFRSILHTATESQNDHELTTKLLDAAVELELALRSDLGIHGIGIVGTDLSPKPGSYWSSTLLNIWLDEAAVIISMPEYEVRPRKDKRGVDLISDVLPFGRLWFGEPNAAVNAIRYAMHSGRSHE